MRLPPASRTGLALLALSLLAGCAAASRSATSPDPIPLCGTTSCRGGAYAIEACIPVFGPDGRLRRDFATDAPVFVAPEAVVASRAPRFNDDGTVCRDAATGSLLYEDLSGGRVVRVLVSAE